MMLNISFAVKFSFDCICTYTILDTFAGEVEAAKEEKGEERERY